MGKTLLDVFSYWIEISVVASVLYCLAFQLFAISFDCAGILGWENWKKGNYATTTTLSLRRTQKMTLLYFGSLVALNVLHSLVLYTRLVQYHLTMQSPLGKRNCFCMEARIRGQRSEEIWKSCRLHWLSYVKSDVKRGNISPDEDLIIRLHKLLGNRFVDILFRPKM